MTISPLLKTAFDAFPNFVIVDADCRIAYINESYTRLLGVDMESVIGKPVTEVIPNTKMPDIIKTGNEELGAVMTLYDHSADEEIHVVCNRIPLIENGKVIGAVAMTTFRDVEDMERLTSEIERMRKENEKYQRKLALLQRQMNPLEQIVGDSPAIRSLKKSISSFATSNLTILLTGETGVGKEVFANALHSMSNRSLNSFVKINCAAIPKDLLESELFGYEKGAFTGALGQGKIGKFELANDGTLLLDEIGEMSLPLQAKLLRVLQEKEIERVGGVKPKKINVRVICSTNRDLPELVRQGKFREDLYYRINTVELVIPPLRDRLSDLPALCDYFIQKINAESGNHTRGIRPDVIALFHHYSWPGNVRELEHIIERLSFLHPDSEIALEDCDFLIEKIHSSHQEMPFSDTSLQFQRDEAEREAIQKAMTQAGGNKTRAAKLLDIDRSMLYHKLKKYGL